MSLKNNYEDFNDKVMMLFTFVIALFILAMLATYSVFYFIYKNIKKLILRK